MSAPIVELCHEDECSELEAFLVERIYAFNAASTGYSDGKLIGGKLRDDAGAIIAAFNGHTWGACCVISHLWVDEAARGRGFGTRLLQAAEAEAVRAGCEQVVLSTHDFQAPEFYERQGYQRQAIVPGHPKGHVNIIFIKHIANP